MAVEIESHCLSPSVSSTPSPYITAPSSPKLHHNSSSDVVPPPPQSEIELRDSARCFVPFNWEEKPGKPKSLLESGADDDYEDIAFEFCVDRFESFSLPAEELFDDGKIKPLKPPPRVQIGAASELPDSPAASSGRRSLSLSSRRMAVSWSARRSYDFSDPFEAAIESARKGHGQICERETSKMVSFDGSKRFSRLRNLLPFRRFSSEGGGRGSEDSKADAGFGSTGNSGSVLEPDMGHEAGNRNLTPCRRRLLGCFIKKALMR